MADPTTAIMQNNPINAPISFYFIILCKYEIGRAHVRTPVTLGDQIGRAHVRTPVTLGALVCRLAYRNWIAYSPICKQVFRLPPQSSMRIRWLSGVCRLSPR